MIEILFSSYLTSKVPREWENQYKYRHREKKNKLCTLLQYIFFLYKVVLYLAFSFPIYILNVSKHFWILNSSYHLESILQVDKSSFNLAIINPIHTEISDKHQTDLLKHNLITQNHRILLCLYHQKLSQSFY